MSGSPAPAVARVTALLGTLMALTVVGSSAVSVALPELAAELGVGTTASSWVLASFSLSFSLATPLFGRLVDVLGLARPLQAGCVLMALGSVLAATAASFPLLVAGRLVQGAGAGAVPVLAVAIIGASVGEARRPRALGGVMAAYATVSASGPLIGGTLAELVGWRAVLAVPVGALLLARPITRLAGSRPRRPGTVDARGALLVAVTAAAAALALQAPATGLPARGAVPLGGLALAAGLVLVVHTRARPDGFLPRAVVGNRSLVGVALAASSLLAAYWSGLFAVPAILADAHGWEPLGIGLGMLPAAAAAALSARLAGRLAGGGWAGTAVRAVGAASAAGLLLGAAGWRHPALLLAGFTLPAVAFGAGQVILLDRVPRLVPERVRGMALGTFNLVFFLGGMVGAATTGGLAGVVALPVALAAVAVLPAAGVVLLTLPAARAALVPRPAP